MRARGLYNPQLLPLEARLALQRAAQTPITVDDPLARVKAIEQATRRVKTTYPSFFKQEFYHEDQT